jgi:hypothetical protein
MPDAAYSEGNTLRTPIQFSASVLNAGNKLELWKVPDGFFGRWRWVHWILNFNAADVTFRQWFINQVGPSGEECGQIIPGFAATGGGGGVTTSPIHELMDATVPVLADEVFQGAAGVQPLWDYSGMSDCWFPNGFSFVLDASFMVAGDQFTNIIGMYELMLGEDSNLSGNQNFPGANALAYLLHQSG